MSKTLALVLVLVAGGGLTTLSLTLKSQVEGQASQIAGLEKKIGALTSLIEESSSEDARTLAARSFEQQGGEVPTSGAAVTADEVRALVEEMVREDASRGSLARSSAPGIDGSEAFLSSDAFRVGVEQAMEAIEEIERAEREARREEQMLSRTERRAQEIAEALQLNNATAQELTSIMVEGAQAMTDVWGLVRAGEFDRREVRGLMTEQRDETNALVQQLLTPTQYETYTEMTETRGGGGGNFGWVGGRGGFGGPGGGNSSGGSSGGSNSSGAGNDTPPAGGGPGGGRGGF